MVRDGPIKSAIYDLLHIVALNPTENIVKVKNQVFMISRLVSERSI